MEEIFGYLQTKGDGALSFCKIDNLIVKPELYPYIDSLIQEYGNLTEEDKIQFLKSLLKYVEEIPNPELWKDVFNNKGIDDAKKLIQTELSKNGQRDFKVWATKIYFAIKYNSLIRDVKSLHSNKVVITIKMVDNLLYFSDFMESINVQHLKEYSEIDYIQKNDKIKLFVLQIFENQDFQLKLKTSLNFKRYQLPMPYDFDFDKLQRLFHELTESKKRIESDQGEKEKQTKKEIQFIDSNTDKNIFLSLFKGGIEEGTKIVWIEKKYYFQYLMRELYDRKTLKNKTDTIHKIFVDRNGIGLNLQPDPNGRDQKEDTIPKQNIIKNIIRNCK